MPGPSDKTKHTWFCVLYTGLRTTKQENGVLEQFCTNPTTVRDETFYVHHPISLGRIGFSVNTGQ